MYSGVHPQDTGRQTLARRAPSLRLALHPDQLVLAQPRRTVVRAADHQENCSAPPTERSAPSTPTSGTWIDDLERQPADPYVWTRPPTNTSTASPNTAPELTTHDTGDQTAPKDAAPAGTDNFKMLRMYQARPMLHGVFRTGEPPLESPNRSVPRQPSSNYRQPPLPRWFIGTQGEARHWGDGPVNRYLAVRPTACIYHCSRSMRQTVVLCDLDDEQSPNRDQGSNNPRRRWEAEWTSAMSISPYCARFRCRGPHPWYEQAIRVPNCWGVTGARSSRSPARTASTPRTKASSVSGARRDNVRQPNSRRATQERIAGSASGLALKVARSPTVAGCRRVWYKSTKPQTADPRAVDRRSPRPAPAIGHCPPFGTCPLRRPPPLSPPRVHQLQTVQPLAP